jgi:hypothetical protein
MKKLSLKTWIADFKLVLVRFPFTLLFIIGLSVLCFLSIQKVKVEIRESLWAFFILGTLLNVTVTLYLEEFRKMSYRILLNILSTLLLAVYCFTLPEKLFDFQHYQMVALGAVFALSAFFISFLKRNNDIPFWNFSRDSIIEMFISSVFSGVLFIGLSLAVLSLDKLFAVQIHKEVYSNLAVVCFVIFAPVYFLSNIPDEVEKRKQEISFNKIIKIFGLYILLPILAVYTLILYVYLLRIIFKWELPNGWVSTLVSILGLVGFLCMIILYPIRLSKENKIPELFSRYFSIVLFPLLVLMSVGIFRRLGDYGLTINRCYVLILNAWLFLISIYLFLSQSKHVKWIVISFVLVAFICSVGPWSVYSITEHSLSSRLDKQLIDAHMLKNGKIISVNDKTLKMDSITQIKVVETLRYLVRTYGNQTIQKYFTVSLKEKSESEIVSIMNMNGVPKSLVYFSAYLERQYMQQDIKPYHSFLVLNMNQYQKFAYNNNSVNVEFMNDCLLIHSKLMNTPSYKISLKDKIKTFIRKNHTYRGNDYPKEMMTLEGDNYILILKSISGNYDFQHDKLSDLNFEAYLFY